MFMALSRRAKSPSLPPPSLPDPQSRVEEKPRTTLALCDFTRVTEAVGSRKQPGKSGREQGRGEKNS